MTWLLVEDDNDIRNVVAVMMSVWGEKPLPFADGNAAWAWLDSVANGTFTGELPDLALMDIRMPGYTGDKVAARIRQIASIKDIPIILMTAFSLSDVEVQSMREQAGFDHLINKPLPDMEVFRSTLYRVRDERRAMLASRQQAAESAKPAEPVQPSAQPGPAPAAAPQPSTPTPPESAKPAEVNAQQPTPPQTSTQPTNTTPTAPSTPQQSAQQPAKPADQQSPAKPAEPAPRPSEKASEKEPK